MTKIRIVAAVVDTRRLTLYKEDGETIRIPQGDERVQRIIDETKEDLLLGKVAEVELGTASGEQPTNTNTYADFEEKSGGVVRFLRTAKSRVAKLFGGSDLPQENQSVEDDEEGEPLLTLGSVEQNQLDAALKDISDNAIPMDNDEIDEETETVVAVIDDTPIPGVEGIKDHLVYANKLGSPEGVQNFLRRISKVIQQRRHSIDDLLLFMKNGDLPIADDGSIIIYKVLRRAGSGGYVDCHTRKVNQKVGSMVLMDPSLVDPDRRQQCSNGLHVARRGYISSFPGDVCILGKVAPEDVIAVPSYDANKMRVCGYHILFELTEGMYAQLRLDKPITNTKDGQKLLARAISGNHPEPVEDVRITAQKGGGVVVTPRGEPTDAPKAKAAPAKKPKMRRATSIERTKRPEPKQAPAVDPRKVSKEVTQTKTRAQKIKDLVATMDDKAFSRSVRAKAALDLIQLRKQAKKSWDALGYPQLDDLSLQQSADLLSKPAAKKVTKPKKAKSAAEPKAKTTFAAKAKPGTSVADEARKLFDAHKWAELKAFKSKKKKGWSVLGFTDAETTTILNNI